MTYFQALEYQKIALRAGLLFVGSLLLIGALDQLRTGKTTGREGKREGAYHVVRLSEMPGYFWFLFFVRLIGGVSATLCSLFLNG